MSQFRFMRHHRHGAAGWGIGLLLLIGLSSPAMAIDIQVDVLGDPAPNGCTPGDCSLREAVILANSLAGPDRILLPATPGVPLQLTIPGEGENAGATGDLDVLDDLEIIGTGATTTRILQTAQDRVLQTLMASNRRLVLRGLTIQGGRGGQGGALAVSSLLTIEDAAFVGNTASIDGGAILHSGIYAPEIIEPRLVLRRVRFENNVVTESTHFGNGGALHGTSGFSASMPYAVIEDCEFNGNQSWNGGGAVYLNGSINWHGGSVVVRRTGFNGNRSGDPGGAAMMVTSSSFDVRIEDSRFEDNVATGADTAMAGALNFERFRSGVLLRTTLSSNSGNRGGALRSTGPLQVIDSHFSGNTAAFAGGALWGHSEILLDRSTFVSNRVTSTSSTDSGGGAIGFSGTVLAIQRSTFSGNDAYRGGAISLIAGRMQLYGSTLAAATFGIAGRLGTVLRIMDETSGNTLGIANSIVNGTCTFSAADRRLAVAYNNIEAPGDSCRLTSAIANAQNQTSATTAQINLAPLADNGGPTLTRAPGAGSIAINQGRESHCTTTDQRHYARNDALCDIGAVEVGATLDELFRSGFD